MWFGQTGLRCIYLQAACRFIKYRVNDHKDLLTIENDQDEVKGQERVYPDKSI